MGKGLEAKRGTRENRQNRTSSWLAAIPACLGVALPTRRDRGYAGRGAGERARRKGRTGEVRRQGMAGWHGHAVLRGHAWGQFACPPGTRLRRRLRRGKQGGHATHRVDAKSCLMARGGGGALAGKPPVPPGAAKGARGKKSPGDSAPSGPHPRALMARGGDGALAGKPPAGHGTSRSRAWVPPGAAKRARGGAHGRARPAVAHRRVIYRFHPL